MKRELVRALLLVCSAGVLLSGCGSRETQNTATSSETGAQNEKGAVSGEDTGSASRTPGPKVNRRQRQEPGGEQQATRVNSATLDTASGANVTSNTAGSTASISASAGTSSPVVAAGMTANPPAPPVADSVKSIRQQISANATQAQFPAEAAMRIATELRNIENRVNNSSEYSKDQREQVLELAGKVGYQIDEASKSADHDAKTKNLSRAESLLGQLEWGLAGKSEGK